MAEYLNREAAVSAIYDAVVNKAKEGHIGPMTVLAVAQGAVIKLPAADVEPVRHGKKDYTAIPSTVEKVKAIDPVIIVGEIENKPYYGIRYFDVERNNWIDGYGSYNLKYVKEWLSTCFDVVEADVEPVRHGHWIETERTNIWGDKVKVLCCSACNCFKSHGKGITVPHNYCPNCGAKMDKKDGDIK